MIAMDVQSKRFILFADECSTTDLPNDLPWAGQTRFWTPNPPDPPVTWKTCLKFDWTVNDAFNLLTITNLWGQLSLENIR